MIKFPHLKSSGDKKINQLNIVVHTNREGRDTFPVGIFVLHKKELMFGQFFGLE